jgi:asparagine synthase (glutamine-hydrolysing)
VFRYCAFFWSDDNGPAAALGRQLVDRCRAQSAAWETAIDEPGMAVLCAGATPSQPVRVLKERAGRTLGAVLGDLFTASPVKRCYQLGTDESERIVRTSGRQLISRYWGNYVALLRAPATRSRWVVRAPAATLPCMHLAISGVDVYFSWTEAVAALDAASFSVNWPFVARSLVAPLASTYTGYNEIRAIPAGFCKETIGERNTLRRYWDPVEIAKGEAIADFDEATDALHSAAVSCAHAWAEGVPCILHALSGGLDSSIVLGCLNTAPAKPDIVCMTHFGEGPDSDERSFARLAASRAHRELIEYQQPVDIDLHGVLHGVRFATSPGMRIPDIDRIEPDLAHERHAEIITRGHGGDELFCRHHTMFYVADFIRDRAFHPALFPLLLHAAFTEGETVWTVFAGAIRNAFFPRAGNMMQIFTNEQAEQSLLHPDITAQLATHREFELPAGEFERACAPGKLWQINLLGGHRHYYLPSMREGDARQALPLLSQPLIETCLRIPTYLKMEDRRERAVARAAFVREVPQEILERRWKGGAEQLAWRMMRRNLPFIRELVLEGELIRSGLLNRPRLESLLNSDPASVVRATVPVFDLIGVEAWLQAWSLRTRRSP